MKKSEHRLVLGTAQLGMNYGIANNTGQPDKRMATEIVAESWKNGICRFDTAQAYGTSEQVLGEIISEIGIGSEVKIISKFHPEIDHTDKAAMSGALDRSLNRLGVSQIHAMMVHSEESLCLWNNGLGDILLSMIDTGNVKHTGISVYSPETALRALETDGIDMIQLPGNILDRRFERAGVFDLAFQKKKKIYIRSVFLQGLILMEAKKIPEKMGFAKPVIGTVEKLAEQMRLSREEIALGYIKHKFPKSRVIFGAESPEQVRRNIVCWKKNVKRNLVTAVEKAFNHIDGVIQRPDLWPR